MSTPQPSPKPPRRGVRPLAVTGIALASLSLGAIAGAAGNTTPPTDSPTTPVTPATTHTITATATATITRDRYNTPQACRDAITAADTVQATAGRALAISGEGFYAVANEDIATLAAKSRELQELNPLLETQLGEYRTLRGKCLG